VTLTQIDTTGLNCPLPFFKLRRALSGFAQGTRLEVLSTDPLAPGDFAELCAALGHLLLETTQDGPVARTMIVVGGAQGPK